MPNLLRRMFLRNGIVAASAATVLSLNLPLAAQSTAPGFFHVFLFQWKQGTTEAQQQRATKDILAFKGVIPGLLHANVGPNLSLKGKGFTFGGVMQFTNRAAFDAYVKHPAHQALLVWLVPLIDPLELDIVA
jgi:hypothetical protein